MFFFGKSKSAVPAGSGKYDRDRQEPVLRCSICNGEQVAGFLDKTSGSFQEVTLIRNPADLEAFRREYAVPDGEIRKIY
ncbi:MAG: aspartate dehydrogenase [Sarcina sp.]|nr:aspartate dehydrogenase [Sarcina sp.]